jgi:uncharacterized membrane protein (DUF4010 family)
LIDTELLTRFALALGLGLLVGLQRQRVESHMAGIRTFSLITLFGAVCAALAQSFGVALLAGGLVAVAGLAVMGNLLAMRQANGNGQFDAGLTTEVAMVLMYAVGAYAMVGDKVPCLMVAGGVAVLLHLKDPLHKAIASLGDRDFWAIIQFILISVVILPIVPDRTIGPYDVVNPRDVWWMVVLIVGIGLAGYLVYKFFGEKAGTLLGGILGGLVSSTATAASWAQSSRGQDALVPIAAVVIVVSTTVSFVRVLIEIAVVAPNVVWQVFPPILLLLAALVVFSWLEHRRAAGDGEEEKPQLDNPSKLGPAFIFAALYAGILIAIAFAKEHLGEGGLYLVALLSGLTDMDAITLSTSHLMQDGSVETSTGWRLIMTAALANLAFKLGTLATVGPVALTRRVALRFGSAAAVGLALIFLWPA